MTAFLIILSLLFTAASIAFLALGVKWALDSLSAAGGCIDLDDCI